jgi:hypothetical protein
MADKKSKNNSVKVYRISNTITVPNTHLMSVISDGSNAYYVYPDEIISALDKKSIYPTWAKSVDKEYLTAIENEPTLDVFVEAILSSSIFYGVTDIYPTKNSMKDTVKSEFEYFDMVSPPQYDESKKEKPAGSPAQSSVDRQLSDDLAELVGSNKELERFFETGQAEKEPEAMRDFVRLVLEAHDAVDLNPQLADWLAGGPAPEDMEDGLILYPDAPQTIKGK